MILAVILVSFVVGVVVGNKITGAMVKAELAKVESSVNVDVKSLVAKLKAKL